MRYQYFINFNKAVPAWSEFWPNVEAEAINKLVDGQEFYRENIDELKIARKRGDQDNSTVYDTLETWSFDPTKFGDEIEVEIYRGDRTGTLYYAGFFSICDATIDQEYKTFKIKPRVDDVYRSIMEVADAKFDARGQVSGEDVVLGDPQVIGAWNAGSPGASFADFDAWAVGGNNGILTDVQDTNAGVKEGKYVALGGLTSGDVVFIDISAFTKNSGNDPFFDIVDVADASITNEGGTAIVGTGILSFHINTTVGAYLLLYTNLVTDVTNFTMTFTLDISDTVKTNVGALYMTFIEKFITNANLMNLTGFIGNVKSTFIANDAVSSDAPSTIDTYITGNPNGNYVSLNADNPLNEMIISETRHWVTADVTELSVSFLDLMNDIKALGCGWYIDADGDFRIEHIKWFELLNTDSTALDLTSAPFAKYKAEVGAKELQFNKALLSNREQFFWMQNDTVANSEDFIGVDIIYDNLETIENTLKYEIRSVTTDIIFLNDNQATAAADGFCFFQCYIDTGDYVIQKEVGVLSGDNIRNNHMSWANLQDKYWTWRRMSENGDMNDGDTVAFDTSVKFLEQGNIKFGYTSTLSGFTKITTSQGTGQQAETRRNLDTDFLTVLIRYNPYA